MEILLYNPNVVRVNVKMSILISMQNCAMTYCCMNVFINDWLTDQAVTAVLLLCCITTFLYDPIAVWMIQLTEWMTDRLPSEGNLIFIKISTCAFIAIMSLMCQISQGGPVLSITKKQGKIKDLWQLWSIYV